jgi:predicted nucleic acid-binding protein
VPGLVLAELDYFLRDERDAMRSFVSDLRRGAFTHAPPDISQLSRAMEIDRQYADLRLGLVDASLTALAEQLGVRRVATRDVRHFASSRFPMGHLRVGRRTE